MDGSGLLISGKWFDTDHTVPDWEDDAALGLGYLGYLIRLI